MKKLVLGALILCATSAQAFDGELKFATTTKDGLAHTLVLSQWKKDGKGVPSFDYAYEQRAGSCSFRLAGHAIAGFEENGGTVTLDVANPEDEKGRELPQILIFHDHGVVFSLPLEGPVRKVSLIHKLKPDALASTCGSKESNRLSVSFQRR